jgi:hypothetical protein
MNFFKIITAAIADIEKYGYDSQQRIEGWVSDIRQAAIESMIPSFTLESQLRRVFTSHYDRLVKDKQILKIHPEIQRYKLEMIKPKLHAELQRRIMSSSQLIKLNREETINKTLQRFSGWASSVPAGGSKVEDTKDVKKSVSKALKSLPFAERRVMIDQGHKFVADLNNIVAVDGGAIAGLWHSHWRQPGYDFREDHKERDDKYYAIRNNWAIEKGLMNKGAGYTDEITAPGQEVFCRCFYQYIYGLRKLPNDMLTEKGRSGLEKSKGLMNA